MNLKFIGKISFFLLTFMLLAVVSCKKKPSLNGNYEARKKINILLNAAQKQKDTLMNPHAADGLTEEAIKISMFSDNHELIAVANIAALKYKLPESTNLVQGEDYFTRALRNAEKAKNSQLVSEAYFAYCDFLIRENQAEKALNYLNRISENESGGIKEEENKVRKYIIHSKINLILNQPFDQLRNLVDANYLATDLENDSIIYETLTHLSDFYLHNRKYETALEYLNELKKSIESKTPVDSVKWYYTEANRLLILNSFMDHEVIPDVLEKIDQFAKKKNIPRLQFQAQSTLRTYFINNNQYKEMDNWYQKNPQELRNLKTRNLTYFHRVKAFIAESRGEIDSARHYFELSATPEEENNPYYYYTYYLRKGEFEKRQGQAEAALSNLEESFQYSLQTNNYYDQIKLGEQIAAQFRELGNSAKELQYLNLINTSKNSLIQFLGDENVQNVELNNVLAQKDLERQKIQENRDRKHNRQYLIITFFIILVIMSVVVISFYSVPLWWIRAMSYISIIMFFEFFVLLVGEWLHHIGHDSPVVVLLAKVLVFSAFFPLHHWIEKTIVTMLLNKKDLNRIWHQFLKIINIKKEKANQSAEHLNLDE